MPVGNLQSGAGQLKDATQKLSLAWQTVRDSWADQQAIHFEEETIIPLMEELAAVMPVIDQMSATMLAANRALDE